jgi:hypothetical protein
MIDMNNLNQQLQLGREELAANDKAILSLQRRIAIWRAMIDENDADLSYHIRLRLNTMCVRHVQDVWYRAFPDDSGVEDLLTLAQNVADGQADPAEAEERARSYFEELLFDVEPDSITEPATFVADAAASAVMSACHRDLYYEVDMDSDLKDDDLLPDSLDLSYACSAAAACGLNWQAAEDVDVNARRAFWTWYLDEAIPAAMNGKSLK